MKKTPLTCEIARGELIIRIGVETLAFAVNNGVAIAGCKVTDAAGFAQDVLAELQSEQEDGTTTVHLLLDAAAARAVDFGSQFVEEEQP